MIISIVFGIGFHESILKIDGTTTFLLDTFNSVAGVFGGQLFGRVEPPVSYLNGQLGYVDYLESSIDVGQYIYNKLLPPWLGLISGSYIVDIAIYPRTYNVILDKTISADFLTWFRDQDAFNNMIRVRMSVRNFEEKENRVYDLFIGKDNLSGLEGEKVLICADLNAQAYTINTRYSYMDEFIGKNANGQSIDLHGVVPDPGDIAYPWGQRFRANETDVMPKDVITSYFRVFGYPIIT